MDIYQSELKAHNNPVKHISGDWREWGFGGWWIVDWLACGVQRAVQCIVLAPLHGTLAALVTVHFFHMCACVYVYPSLAQFTCQSVTTIALANAAFLITSTAGS